MVCVQHMGKRLRLHEAWQGGVMDGQEQVMPHALNPPSSLPEVVLMDCALGKDGLSGTVREGFVQEDQLLPIQAAEAGTAL